MLVKTDYKKLILNPFTLVGDEWMLIAAGNEQHGYNSMTISWGHLGSIWGHNSGRPSVVVYVRPQRYTKEFIDREEYFTLSVFPSEYKKQLGYLGSHSGRDGDKIAHCGLTPVFSGETTYFEQAQLVFICNTLYRAPVKEEFFSDKSLVSEYYPNKHFHDMYIGEITEVFASDEYIAK